MSTDELLQPEHEQTIEELDAELKQMEIAQKENRAKMARLVEQHAPETIQRIAKQIELVPTDLHQTREITDNLEEIKNHIRSIQALSLIHI